MCMYISIHDNSENRGVRMCIYIVLNGQARELRGVVGRTMFLTPLVELEEVEWKVLEMGEGEAFWWGPAQQCHVLILNTGESCTVMKYL